VREDGVMDLFPVKEKKKILAICDHLISKRVEISVKIEGSDAQFITKVLKVKSGKRRNHLIIEKLHPEAGNSLIQSSTEVLFTCEVSESKCVFATNYIGINTQYPEFGLIVGIPPTIQIEDKRREERIENGLTKFLSVEFRLEGDRKVYHLKVINLGPSGIGFIVDKENLDLLNKVTVGETIRNLRFFLPQATLTIDAEVKHVTPINQGESRGSYIVGIKSGFIMKLKELRERLEKKR